MNTLLTGTVATTLNALHDEAAAADHAIYSLSFSDDDVADYIADHIAQEKADYKSVYKSLADNFLSVAPEFGQLLYACVRARRPECVVEFGSSMGISAIYLACGLRDNQRGHLVGTELEESKARRAEANLAEAGLGEYVEFRVGDALSTLQDLDGPVDMVLLDGAFALYLPVLKILEPRLTPGALIVADNAEAFDYQEYVRDPRNGYLSLTIPFDGRRGNELTVYTG